MRPIPDRGYKKILAYTVRTYTCVLQPFCSRFAQMSSFVSKGLNCHALLWHSPTHTRTDTHRNTRPSSLSVHLCFFFFLVLLTVLVCAYVSAHYSPVWLFSHISTYYSFSRTGQQQTKKHVTSKSCITQFFKKQSFFLLRYFFSVE